jgi:hypothetical protein
VNHVGDWCRVRQIGKIMLQLMTRGSFYDEEDDDVVLTYHEQTWHNYEENVLSKRYPGRHNGRARTRYSRLYFE